MKNGKVNIAKKDVSADTLSVMFGGSLDIPAPILDHIKALDQSYKFINTTLMKKRGGTIYNGWIPLKLPEEVRAKLPENPFAPAESKDYFVVGDLVLATRSKEITKKHKENLQFRMNAQTESIYQQEDAKGNKLISKEDN